MVDLLYVFAVGLHIHTAVACLPLCQRGFLANLQWKAKVWLMVNSW